MWIGESARRAAANLRSETTHRGGGGSAAIRQPETRFHTVPPEGGEATLREEA